jgi:hypothetical protein
MQPQKGERADSTAERRVTSEQAAVFAAYREDGPPEIAWYKRDPSLLKLHEEATCQEAKEMDEFEWLRLLALDHQEMSRELNGLREYLHDICDAYDAWNKVVNEPAGGGISDPDYPGPSNEECQQHDEACGERWNDVEDAIKTACDAREARHE